MIPTFLAPALLLGTMAVAVPIALHFLFKARYRRVPWAAMSFLKISIEQTRRRVRFQELILLLMRCAALILLALALARPTWNALVGGQGESIDAIFVIDTSLSMSATDGEMSRLDRAKDAASTILAKLPAGSNVQVVTSTDRAEFIGPVRAGNRDEAEQLIRGLTPTSLAGDALPGLLEAEAALDRGTGATAEIYWFGDLQKSGWERQAGAIRGKADELKKRATIIVVQCGNPDRQLVNVTVDSITYPGGIPHTKSRLPVTILVKNTGRLPAKNLTVTLEVQGKKESREVDSIEELAVGQSRPVTLTAKLDIAGPQLLTATVTADDLPGDNRLDRMLNVREVVTVLVIDGAPDSRDPRLSASHFLANALLPVAADQQGEYHVRVEVVPVDEAGAGLLRTADVCVLANVAATNADRPGVAGLSSEFAAALSAFVNAGGGLLIGCGDNVTPLGYETTFGKAGLNLLPATFNEALTTTSEMPWKPAPDTTAAGSYLSRFAEPPFNQVTAEVEITRVQGLRDLDKAAVVLMKLTNEAPWLLTRRVGDGEVILATTSFDLNGSNWPAKGGSYLSFVQFTLAHLAGKGGRGLNVPAGQTFTAPIGRAGQYEWLTSDGERRAMPPVVTEPRLAIVTPRLTHAGAYRLVSAGTAPATDDIVFAVSPDLADTVALDPLTPSELEEYLGFRPVLLTARPDSGERLTYERSRRDWTIVLLLALFALTVCESGWAWYCGRAA